MQTYMGEMYRALIVEDNDDLREGMVTLLRSHGYEVLEATNGEQGLAVLRSRKDVDIVLLDLMMPVMNGATFRWRQRWDQSIANIPVLVLTSVTDGSKSAEVLGADGYLRKPFDADALIAAVTRIRSSRPRRSRRPDNTLGSRAHGLRERRAGDREAGEPMAGAAHLHARGPSETTGVFHRHRARDVLSPLESQKR